MPAISTRAWAIAWAMPALAAAGAGPRDVVKLTVLVVEHSHARLAIFGEELAAAFGGDHRPACTLIPVPRLALDGMLFEIEAMAALVERSFRLDCQIQDGEVALTTDKASLALVPRRRLDAAARAA